MVQDRRRRRRLYREDLSSLSLRHEDLEEELNYIECGVQTRKYEAVII
jgi:hypothetical protein